MHMAVEIISMVERRRRWSVEAKARILEEALAPGASVSAVADRNGVCRSLVYSWMRLARANQLPGISAEDPAATFAPVRIAEPPTSAEVPSLMAPARQRALPRRSRLPRASHPGPRHVEIRLRNGRIIKVAESIEPAVLACLVAVLDRGTA